MEIEAKYKIPLQGEYWAGINSCPECRFRPDTITTEIIGFADSPYGLMTVCECPECFTKWYFHCRSDEQNGMKDSNNYYYFKVFVDHGWQRHYKSEKREVFNPTIIDPRRNGNY